MLGKEANAEASVLADQAFGWFELAD